MMKEIRLTQDKVALVDDQDSWLDQYEWYAFGDNNKRERWCAVRKHDRALMHRLILNAPEGLVVDHINRNALDNRRNNLRLCTRSQNCMNSMPHGGMSQYKGVTWNKSSQRWQAACQGKYIGMYDYEELAAQAYNVKAKELFGEFARLNVC